MSNKCLIKENRSLAEDFNDTGILLRMIADYLKGRPLPPSKDFKEMQKWIEDLKQIPYALSLALDQFSECLIEVVNVPEDEDVNLQKAVETHSGIQRTIAESVGVSPEQLQAPPEPRSGVDAAAELEYPSQEKDKRSKASIWKKEWSPITYRGGHEL